ncbi:MAG: Fic family protein [Desulfuromonas sp.]|nr:MAG: Fic family protein [Desulfuromonas sp.]
MQAKDLSQERQKLLVPLNIYSGAYALIPPPVPRRLDLGKEGWNEIARAHKALNLLEEVSGRLPNPDFITRTWDRREAVRSSQIEGTQSEVDDLLAYEATGSDEGMPQDVRVTKNYVVALEKGLGKVRELGVVAIDCGLIKEIHATLMENVEYNGTPGEFRESQNWIGGGGNIYNARFVPPPPARLQECMDDLENILQYRAPEDEQLVPSILTRMAIAHVQFESIHPFLDGNGRVGRILLPLMLVAEGYPPVYLAGYLKSNQQEYYDTLLGVQLRDRWADWVRFFALGVESAVQESIKTGLALERVLGKWQTTIGGLGLRSDSILHKFPELLISSPVLTAKRAMNDLNTSFPSVSAALSKLVNIGMLSMKEEGSKRNRVFIAHEVIDILNMPVDA